MTDWADSEVLCRDVHPAEVATPDGGVVTGARVFATSHRLLAYVVRDGQIVKTVDVELSDPYSVPAARGTLPRNGRLSAPWTGDGTYWVNRGGGCGCGSPLKALGAPLPWTRREASR